MVIKEIIVESDGGIRDVTDVNKCNEETRDYERGGTRTKMGVVKNVSRGRKPPHF